MRARRKIAVVTSELENIYQQRVLRGVFAQCAKYDYDVAVITTFVETTHFLSENLHGELNIYNLINFDLFDGVIITPSHLFGSDVKELEAKMLKKFREKCHCKVVAIDLGFGDYETVYTDETKEFYEITKHVYEEHWRRKVYFLNGFEDYDVSRKRLAGFLQYTKEMGIEVPKENIINGDFWYTSGEKLAEDIHNGIIEMPDAVICASDHMAIGLVKRLTQYRIRVPEQIAVTGYDATQESALNDIYITSYESKVSETAARAVNVIRKCIEPGAELEDTTIDNSRNTGLRCGESCGCPTDTVYLRKIMRGALLHKKPNWNDVWAGKPIDISILLESYISESVMNTKDYVNCLDQIYHHTFLLHPYGDFWLCLKENWLDTTDVLIDGYPEKMKILIHSQGCSDMEAARSVGFCDDIGPRSFETVQMLPEMVEGQEENSVYYFTPVHFNEETYGYTVMRCPITQEYLLGYVYHNWLRIISNALSVTKLKNQLSELSMRDSVTGLLNRRGVMDWLKWAPKKNNIFVIMIDMDGLKVINDRFGHSEGDFGLIAIARSLAKNTGNSEICARVGGDEFMLIGVGPYDDKTIKNKIKDIAACIQKASEESGKPYSISASMGYCLCRFDEETDVEAMMENADAEMYRNKKIKRK